MNAAASDSDTSAPAPSSSASGRQPSVAGASPSRGTAAKRSFLGAGCKLSGDLEGDGSFECRGDFAGTIDIGGDLLVAAGGSAVADLTARRVTIEGKLTGNATGAEKVEVGPTGHVEGDVRAPAVQFAEGAFFEGNVEMRRPGAAPRTEED